MDPPPQGVLGSNQRNTQKNIEIYFFRTTNLRFMKFGIASFPEIMLVKANAD